MSGHGGDHSAADLALCSRLARFTRDGDRLDRLFRRSGLMRPKWERADYRGRTLARALSGAGAGAGRHAPPLWSDLPVARRDPPSARGIVRIPWGGVSLVGSGPGSGSATIARAASLGCAVSRG